MPAPKKPNTTNATETTLRRGDATAAERLRRRGWLLLPPQAAAELPPATIESINSVLARHASDAGTRQPG